MQPSEQSYNDIIISLATLKDTKPDSDLQNRLQHALTKNSTPSFLSPFRIALSAFVILFFAAGSVAASADARPGEFLYPVKKALVTLAEEVTNKHFEEKPVIPTPTISLENEIAIPTASSTPAPSETIISPSPTILPSVAHHEATQQKEPQDQKPPQANVQVNTQVLGVGASVSTSDTSQSPAKNNEKEPNEEHKPIIKLPVQANVDVSLSDKPVIKLGL